MAERRKYTPEEETSDFTKINSLNDPALKSSLEAFLSEGKTAIIKRKKPAK